MKTFKQHLDEIGNTFMGRMKLKSYMRHNTDDTNAAMDLHHWANRKDKKALDKVIDKRTTGYGRAFSRVANKGKIK